ncbi:UDP-N-acetylglucosamine 2-epimerase (non-hydrolyzing) [Gaetbulibacter aquiaggeris]|uniref:UDP-N-acetylglucosamine 2-epimerase (Non-hydrolyzing) n=1 Tax=Gaetbulibacter aquiaggeris TaxID=1735373 RepID=A0ABW7MS75_9FLAO
MIIDIIAGARPNFIKIAPLVDALKSHIANGLNISYRLIHTGQHYDEKMSSQFFKELGIPEPTINFGIGSGSQASQTAAIMLSYENLLLVQKSNLCIVVGDVNSTMACSIVAKKNNIKVAHVEAGIRSRDMTMPEEINRIITDSITDYFFTTSQSACDNLRAEGVASDKIFFVGNTMIDTLVKFKDHLKRPPIWNELNLQKKEYILLTLHRPSNVDVSENLKLVLEKICENSKNTPIIFPVHPRTLKVLETFEINYNNLHFTEPMGYLEFNFLTKHAMVVITDSGGITEETTVMGVPCITFRETTERPETVSIGTNELVGTNPEIFNSILNIVFDGKWKRGNIPDKWDGKTAERILSVLKKIIIDKSI